MKFSSTRIVTRDVTALADFYKMVTQIAPVGSADFVEFRTSGGILALCSQRAVDAHNAGAAVAAANRSSILEFQVDDVDSERARLGSTVTDWVQEPIDQPWGNRAMLFRDPDGNLINIFAWARRSPNT